jgi:hypothetical protein
MAHVPDFILYGDDDDAEPTAEPAFRTLVYLAGSMNDDGVREGLTALFDAFISAYQARLWRLVIRDVGVRKTPRAVNKASISLAQDWLATTTKVFGSSLRLNAAPDDVYPAPRVPHLRFEERRKMVMIEIAGPPDAQDARHFADKITPSIVGMPLFCGVMGFGFHMPAAFDSRGFILPARTARYRCAIEWLLDNPSIGVTLEGSPFRFEAYPHVNPGIADIGWRTIIGHSFLDRLPELDLVGKVQGVSLDRRPDVAILTIGPHPIWGDVSAGEDISAYSAVARALAPVTMAREIMLKGYFNGPEGNSEAEERLDAYRARFA